MANFPFGIVGHLRHTGSYLDFLALAAASVTICDTWANMPSIRLRDPAVAESL